MSVFSKITRRPKTVLIVFVVLFIFSLSIIADIPVDLQPKVDINKVTVYTIYPEANPELIEETITKPIERAINAIDNIKKIYSSTDKGTSMITVEFKYKSGMDTNVDNLRTALDDIEHTLPDDAKKPRIYRFGANGDPVVTVLINANRNHNEIHEYINNTLLIYMEQINGVSFVNVLGGVSKQVIIDISLNRLNAYNLTMGEIKNSIQANGYSTSLGTINTTFKKVGVVVKGEYESVEEIKNIIVAERKINNSESVYIRLRDIANVTFRYLEEARQIYFNGKPAVNAIFFKDNDSNIVEVAKNIRAELVRLNAISPDDFEFKVFSDFSGFVNRMLEAVSNTALSGGILAVLVLVLFLRNIASVLSIVVSIPISIIFTIMCMYYYGLGLNFMTLAGLAMGIGLIVDNSIVVLENIYMKRKNKVNLLPAAEYGVSEMAMPVFASTLTTVLVFLPMLLFEKQLGVIGAYFTNLGFAIVISIIVSYLSAILLVPVLTSTFIPLHVNKTKGFLGKINTFFDSILLFLENSYEFILSYILKRRKRFILLIVVLAFLPFSLFSRLNIAFIPDFAQDGISIDFDFPVGTSNEDMFVFANQFEDRIKPLLPEVRDTLLEIVGGGSTTRFFDSGKYTGAIRMMFVDFMQSKQFELLEDELSDIAKEYPVSIYIGKIYGEGSFGLNQNLTLKIQSKDKEKLRRASDQFMTTMRDIPNYIFVYSDLSTSDVAIALHIDRENANAYGATVSGISDELRLAINNNTVSKYKQGSKEYTILMKLQDEDRNRSDLFQQLYIKTPKAQLPLANVIVQDVSNTEQEILREDASRTVTLSIHLAQDYSIDNAITDAREALSQLPISLDEDITYFFGGEFEERNKTNVTLMLIFFFAVIFVFGVMASQFESFSDPFLIIFTIPLAFSGVILIYFFTGNQITAFSLAGTIILVGISVNHGIVLVDRINTLRKRNMELLFATAHGARDRFQPILMTTLTTIGGMLPFALSSQAGTELIKPLALTVVGGLGTSAMLSLFFIPLIYGSFHTMKYKILQKRKAKRQRIKEKQESELLEQANFPTMETISKYKEHNETH